MQKSFLFLHNLRLDIVEKNAGIVWTLINKWVAAIAQWIRLRLPSCRLRFESQAYHLSFYKFIIVSCGKDENKRKRGRDWPIF